jgi:hypothetical protein
VKARCDDQVTASVSALLRAAFRNPPVLANRGTFSRRRHYRSRDEVWLHKPYIFCAVARD